MYIPAPFRIDRPELVREFIERYSFATLIVDVEGEPIISHVPLLTEGAGPHPEALVGHLAAANPACAGLRLARRIYAVFAGPHTYVSPTYYTSEVNVPTWNYMVVHVSGVPHIVSEPDEAMHVLAATTEKYERANGTGWSMDRLGPGAKKMLPAIVAFRMSDLKIEAKFKLGQNRTEADRTKLKQALGASDDPDRRAIAAMMDRLQSAD